MAGVTASSFACSVSVAQMIPPSESEILVERGAQSDGARSEYVVGISLKSSPEYGGSSQQSLSLTPVLAFRYGRFRLSSSGGSSILNTGGTATTGGASADLIDSQHWNLNASLRIGGGRQSSDSESLAGLPDIEKTVFAKLSTSYTLTERWNAQLTIAWDLLGRGNGVALTTGLGYQIAYSKNTKWSAGGSVAYGNATHMNSLFGVPSDAELPDRMAYVPGAGLKSLGIGIGMISTLTERWVLFSNLGATRLLGAAAASPLARSRYGLSGTIGIAWKCCR